VAAPHPSPLPASGERETGRRLRRAFRFRPLAPALSFDSAHGGEGSNPSSQVDRGLISNARAEQAAGQAMVPTLEGEFILKSRTYYRSKLPKRKCTDSNESIQVQ